MGSHFNPHTEVAELWVPHAVRCYVEHTVLGRSIHAIARDQNCQPSTLLRQMRRLESRRDDPFVDRAMRNLTPHGWGPKRIIRKEEAAMLTDAASDVMSMKDGLTQTRIDREALKVLRRLCEKGAVLALAKEMETAVVAREDETGQSLRTAVVEREIAQAMAQKEWINCDTPEARVARYFITAAGRDALRRLTAQEENRALGLKKTGLDRRDSKDEWDLRQDLGGGSRYIVTESPLVGLARRKDRAGEPFLSKEQVNVGESLRQDFELSQISGKDRENWRDAMLEGIDDATKATQNARRRVISAMDDLGPGLSDVVLNCCCFLTGLEQTEKELGWSSRSGKIVLRIALARLVRHYAETQGKYAPLIG